MSTFNGSSKEARGQSPEPRQLIPRSRGRRLRLYGEIGEGTAVVRGRRMPRKVVKVRDFMAADAGMGTIKEVRIKYFLCIGGSWLALLEWFDCVDEDLDLLYLSHDHQAGHPTYMNEAYSHIRHHSPRSESTLSKLMQYESAET
jgi:hypothetical protein